MDRGMMCMALVALMAVCRCVRAGGNSAEDSSYGIGPTGSNCRCGNTPRSNPCLTNVGTNPLGCPGLNAYVQCQGVQCLPMACPPGQVWTAATAQTAAGCAPCPAGRHIRADGTRCVCDINTIANKTGACVACPGGAVVTNDLCYCPPTTRLDKVNNLCRACPAGTYLGGDSGCTCADRTTLFNPSLWSCGPCPGSWVTVNRKGSQACRCTGPNQILNKANLSCFTCPTGTSPDQDNDSCVCPGLFQRFDIPSGQCVCGSGTQLNAATGTCQFPPVVSPINPINP